MLAFTAAMLFAANVTPAENFEEAPASELEIVLGEGMEAPLETDEIVFDDSLLSETDSELIELEE